MTVLMTGCASAPVASGVFAVSPEWTFDTPDAIIATPRVSGDTIILHTEKQVIAVDALTRNVLWAADSPGSIYGSAPPIVAGGVVVVPEDSNPFAAFDLATGALLWRKCFLDPYAPGPKDCSRAPSGMYIDDLQISQGIVTVSDFDGELTAYDVRTGNQIWQIEAPGRGGPSDAIDNGVVYLDQLDSSGTVRLLAVDLSTGATRWQVGMEDVLSKLVAQDGIVYFSVGVGDSSLATAVAGEDGSTLWEIPVDGGPASKVTYLTLDGETLFIAGYQLTSISLKGGKIDWREGNEAGFMRPIVFGNMVLARDKHLLYAFNKLSGGEIGRLSLEVAPGRNNVELDPAVYGDLVLIPVGKTRLAAYRLTMP